MTIKLIFEIAEADKPDYVVFKRTAMAIIEREEEPSVQAEKRQEAESAGEGPEDKPIPKIE